MPTGRHLKAQLNARVSELAFEIVKALQDHYGISQSAIIELLLREKARELGWDLDKLPRKLG